MILSARFKNFRGLNNLEIPLSPITILTGTNGVGKTSVLEGLYCLFSQTRLDVSPLSRYNKSFDIGMNQAVNIPIGFAIRQNYNYKLFWDECPAYGESECSVYAKSDNLNLWSWTYKKAKLSDLSKLITANNPIQVDASSEFALWDWNIGKEYFQRAQLLTQDGGLYLFPSHITVKSICLYMDFVSLRFQPKNLPFQTAKQLTKALQIINPHITDIRLKDTESGLSVIIDDNYEVSLGTIGNGAVTWASALIAIFSILDLTKQLSIEMPLLILIDEMGAGIHYSIMHGIWKFLDEFGRQNPNLQFVFTSHSDDCIRAFCETFYGQNNSSIVRLHQNSTNKKIIPTEYKGKLFQNIINGEWEVRG